MISNYYTFRSVAADLNNKLAHCEITALFSQNKNELIIRCSRTPAADRWSEYFLVILCEPSLNAMYLHSAFARARRNTVDLFRQICGTRISGISLRPADRDIRFSLENNLQLAAQLYGSKANVHLADREGNILESFLRRDSHSAALAKSAGEEIPLPASPDSLGQILGSAGQDSLLTALKRSFPLLGSTLIRELLYRAALTENAPPAGLTEPESARLFTCYHALMQELDRAPSPRIYFDGESPRVFSTIELHVFRSFDVRTFSNIHEAVRIFLSLSHRRHSVLREKSLMLANIDREEHRAERTLGKISSELEGGGRAIEYETIGKLLMANLHEMRKGMKRIVLENAFSPAREIIQIPLDPALLPVRNAERYFEKGKKSRHAVTEARERKGELEKRFAMLERLRETAEQVETPEQWEDFVYSNQNELRASGIKATGGRRPQEKEVPFRVFRVDGGFEVWAGKRSDNNDLLTFKYARPNDLWFHARGSSGSHVILRKGTGKGEVSRKAIEQAAGIAAYYSKMKTSGLVPVALTERKYVRKPRGAPAGTVTIQREKVLMVKPGLPGDIRHGKHEDES